MRTRMYSCGQITNDFPNMISTAYYLSQRWLVVRAKYYGISHAWGHRFRIAVSKAWETFGREDSMFRPTRSSEFSHCLVMVAPGCSEKNTVPPDTREVTATHSPWIGAPHVCPLFVSFPVVIAYVSVHLSLVIEMRVYFVSSGLKNTGWAPRV